jgi:hypothetical protein
MKQNPDMYLLSGVRSVDDEYFYVLLVLVGLFLGLVVHDGQNGSAFAVSNLKKINQSKLFKQEKLFNVHFES